MSARTLSFGYSRNPRLEPLVDGRVRSPGLDLKLELVHPYELFLRMLQQDDLDVSEFAVVDYLKTRELGGGARWQWVGLPIFLSRAFLWFDLYVREGANIRSIADLRGKRIAVPDYTMAATLCMRMSMKTLHGIRADENQWFNTRPKQYSLGCALDLTEDAPGGVRLQWLDADQVTPMLLSGELDAAYGDGYIGKMPGTHIRAQPGIRPLFPDRGKAVVIEYARRTGAVLANHMVVVQKRAADALPVLYNLFERSKAAAYDQDPRNRALFQDMSLEEQAQRFGPDPFTMGLEANRRMLELLVEGAREEGWLKDPVDLAAAFWEPGR